MHSDARVCLSGVIDIGSVITARILQKGSVYECCEGNADCMDILYVSAGHPLSPTGLLSAPCIWSVT